MRCSLHIGDVEVFKNANRSVAKQNIKNPPEKGFFGGFFLQFCSVFAIYVQGEKVVRDTRVPCMSGQIPGHEFVILYMAHILLYLRWKEE